MEPRDPAQADGPVTPVGTLPDPVPTAIRPGGGGGGLGALSGSGVARMATTDVGAHKAKARSARLQRTAAVLGVIAVLLVLRDVLAPGAPLPTPSVPSSFTPYLLPIGLIVLLVAVWPANIYMAIAADHFTTVAPAWVIWLRVPLQLLLIWWVAAARRA